MAYDNSQNPYEPQPVVSNGARGNSPARHEALSLSLSQVRVRQLLFMGANRNTNPNANALNPAGALG